MATALATAGPASAHVTLPPQGLYEECAPSDQSQCASELAQMGSAGFQLALNYTAWYGSAAQIEAYASEAQANRIKIIWPLDVAAWRDPGSASSLPRTYPLLAPDCACTANGSFLQYVIGLVRSLPATWGYYIGDEVPPSQAPQVAALAAAVRAADPTHPLLFIGQAFPDTVTNLAPFEPIADVVGADVYPIGAGGSAATVGPVASTVQRLSTAGNSRPAIVLQAFDWSQYPTEIQAIAPRWPTRTEMQGMRNGALSAAPSMILWYSIHDILRSDNPAAHWQDLTAAAFAPVPAATANAGTGQGSGGHATVQGSGGGPTATQSPGRPATHKGRGGSGNGGRRHVRPRRRR